MTVNCTTARRHCTRLASLSLALEKSRRAGILEETNPGPASPRQGPLKEYRAKLLVRARPTAPAKKPLWNQRLSLKG
ncbi:MAG: hypothetical protein EXR99_09565 [Gemmataceae bacterium]|nr:hypothetical protein [Gemmataceae bacterium]